LRHHYCINYCTKKLSDWVILVLETKLKGLKLLILGQLVVFKWLHSKAILRLDICHSDFKQFQVFRNCYLTISTKVNWRSRFKVAQLWTRCVFLAEILFKTSYLSCIYIGVVDVVVSGKLITLDPWVIQLVGSNLIVAVLPKEPRQVLSGQ